MSAVNSSREKVAVFGGGIMGRGIAQAFLMGGYRATLLSRSEATLAAARAHIAASLEKLGSFGLARDPEGALARLTTTTDKAEALKGAVLLAEAIDERLEAKQELFAECERWADSETIFATNASHLDPEEIFSGLASRKRCLAAHWFNPAQLVPLVEVARLSYTEAVYWEKTVEMLKRAGKTAVKLKKPIQGLLINRLFCALAREACHLNDIGVADIEEIDEAVKATIGLRNFCIGVFKTMDLGGLSDWRDCLELLLPLMDNSTRPPDSMEKMLAEGRAGIRAGRGYYRYERSFDSAEMDKEIVDRDEMMMRLLKLKGFAW
ncbi:MAG: 3-hydroxyacyl-CoA dehydrogenase family protein [Candidatus Adiutrix sp.]|jgi:3-hydroxybutyryl-CoA dehydrogenase|nr:3-hydroxyacyl-CoA dehydrogenase family protein [Candidatus Adiutrix sp.]